MLLLFGIFFLHRRKYKNIAETCVCVSFTFVQLESVYIRLCYTFDRPVIAYDGYDTHTHAHQKQHRCARFSHCVSALLLVLRSRYGAIIVQLEYFRLEMNNAGTCDLAVFWDFSPYFRFTLYISSG